MLKFGFFDSINGDRKYNSRDVAELFDGIIVDGIYAQIGEKFSVNPKRVIESEEDKMTITVGTGQAWLSHTKVLNTTEMEFLLSESVGANRYDALIIEVNDNTRSVSIFVKPNVKTLISNAATAFDLEAGQLITTEFIHQYLLAVILVQGGATKITAENIASKVGFAIPYGIPYVTCPLEPFPADETLKQWVAQWYKFFTDSDKAFDDAQTQRNTDFNNAQTQRNTDYQSLRTSIVNWLNSTQTDWNTWYASVKDDFEGYVDTEIDEHNTSLNAHPDLRTSIQNLTTRLNALADSDDSSLDQLSEIVTFIKQNRALIDDLTGGSLENTYLFLNGSNAMTGPIKYKGSKATYEMIRFLDNLENNTGNGIIIGGGGFTAIGGGESVSTLTNSPEIFYGASYEQLGEYERMAICNDQNIDFFTNLQSGVASAIHTYIDKWGGYHIKDLYVEKDTTNPVISIARLVDGVEKRKGALHISSANDLGIWDHTNNKWVLQSLVDGATVCIPSGFITGQNAPTAMTRTNHAIDIGRNGVDSMSFYAYGGIFNFYKSVNGVHTLLGKITENGWEGKSGDLPITKVPFQTSGNTPVSYKMNPGEIILIVGYLYSGTSTANQTADNREPLYSFIYTAAATYDSYKYQNGLVAVDEIYANAKNDGIYKPNIIKGYNGNISIAPSAYSTSYYPLKGCILKIK